MVGSNKRKEALVTPSPVPMIISSSTLQSNSNDSPDASTAMRWLQSKQNYNTYCTYESAFKQFQIWMTTRSRLGVIQMITDSDVVLYIRHMLEKKAAASNTIIVALAAIRNHFRYNEQITSRLNSAMINDAMKIAKRDGKQVVKKKPLTVNMLHEMHKWYTRNAQGNTSTVLTRWVACRDLTMIILMMTCFLRESELIRLGCNEVEIKEEIIQGVKQEVLEVYVRKAKNDQAGQGHLIRVGASHSSPICPVWWIKLLKQKSRGAPNSRLFHDYQGNGLRPVTPCHIVQNWVERINKTNSNRFGHPSTYGSHSCRIGGVTAAHAAGVNMTLIQQHGNWKSDVVYDYIQPSVNQQLKVTQFIEAAAAASSTSRAN